MFLSMFITNLMVFILVILGMTIGLTIVLVYMASREAERELGFKAVEPEEVVGEKIRRITPVKPSPSRILFAVLPPILSITLTLYLLPYLPELVPVHYDINGVPDRWDTLDSFLKITFPYMVGAQCITLIFILVEAKAPMIFYLPGLPKEKLVNLVYDIGIMTAWILLLAYTDILYYAVNSTHLVPATITTALTLILIAVIIARVTLLWIKWRRTIKGGVEKTQPSY